jgi:hypothetical protein
VTTANRMREGVDTRSQYVRRRVITQKTTDFNQLLFVTATVGINLEEGPVFKYLLHGRTAEARA